MYLRRAFNLSENRIDRRAIISYQNFMGLFDVDLDLLRCFVIVAEVKSFTVAGDRLGRSQSAVSVRIKKLEEILESQLFDRSGREVALTPAGRKLLPRAKSILNEGEALVAEMRRPLVSGRLRVGFLEYIALHRIPEILDRLSRRCPEAALTFRIGLSQTLINGLRDGDLDVALALHDPASQDSVPLFEDRLIWVESDSKKHENDSDGINLCLMKSPCLYRSAALEALDRQAIPYMEVVTANSLLSVRNAVAAGIGYSVLGASCVGDGIRRVGKFMDLPELPAVTLGLYGQDPRKGYMVEAFKEVLEGPQNGTSA